MAPAEENGSSVVFEQEIDEALASDAERDLRRALTLQNARIANRFDPVRRYRTRDNDRRLRILGAGVCALGTLLGIARIVFGPPPVSFRQVSLVVLIASAGVVFLFIERIQVWAVGRIDAGLAKTASRLLARATQTLPSRLRYTVSDEAITCDVVTGETSVRRFSVPRENIGYGVRGPGALILFPSKHAQQAIVIVFSTAASDVASAFDGIEIEELSPELLPKTTTKRVW